MIYILLYLIPSVVSVPLWVPIVATYRKENLVVVFNAGYGIWVWRYVFLLFLEETQSDILISILALICGLGAGSGAVVARSIQADIIDYDEYRSGKRKRALTLRLGILFSKVRPVLR